MTVIAGVLTVLVLWGVKVAGPGKFHMDYCSPRKTNGVKGLFVLIVFLSHMRGYITIPEEERTAFYLAELLGQQMVVPFLFWSGYGVMESIKRKGAAYVRQIPLHRIGKTLLHFDLAVAAFLAVRLLLGQPISAGKFLLALIGWESIGNSNWYVFVVLVLYGITWIAFSIFRENRWLGAAAVTAMALGAVFALGSVRDLWWHDTLLCYVLGLWFSLLRQPLEAIVLRKDWIWAGCLGLAAAGWLFVERRYYQYAFAPHLLALVFAVLIVLLGAKISLDNRFLQFLGKYTFWIYILQRLPMILLRASVTCMDFPAGFFLLSFGATCIMSVMAQWVTDRLDRRIFPKTR